MSAGKAHARRPSMFSVPAALDTPVTSRNGTVIPPYTTVYYFDQLIDHVNPSLGTFEQRYYHTYEFYERGGPIILNTPGEENAEEYIGYLTNETVNGLIAQANNGSTIVLEHRYFGQSNPFPDLKDSSMVYNTVQQAIDDLEYFANNVVLPQPDGDSVKPGQAPWILIGGSYSGALTSWTMVNKPNLFQAGWASSAVVEAITDYWAYFEPIRENMAQNCSADVQAVIAHVDSVFTNGTQDEIDTLKAVWNFTELTHLDDAAGALRHNLMDWENLQPALVGGLYWEFCDALEVKDGVNAGAEGWGLDHALQAWGSFWNNTYYPVICGSEDVVDCLGTYDPTSNYFTNTSIDNAIRSWAWVKCHEVGWYQDSPPEGQPALVSRLVQPTSDERQCTYFFPEAFENGTLPEPTADAINTAYDGWFVQVDHLFFANGRRDPWRDATIAADGNNFTSTPGQLLALHDAGHTSDLLTLNGQVDASVFAVQQQGLAAMAAWLAEWTPSVTK